MRPELSIHLVLTSPLPFAAAPTVDREVQHLFVRHFLANVLLLRTHAYDMGLGSVRAGRAFTANHGFITTRAPYKNKTTRNQYLIRRFGYRITVTVLPSGPEAIWGPECLSALASLRTMVGALDFAHASVAFSTTSLRAHLGGAELSLDSTNGRLALPIC